MYEILLKSEILGGKFAPSAHGKFDSFSAAYQHATKNIRYGTEFKVESVK